MPSLQSDTVPTKPSFNTKTNLCGKAMFASNDAINLLNSRPVQPSSKLLDNWFNGNSTTICPSVRPMIRPM